MVRSGNVHMNPNQNSLITCLGYEQRLWAATAFAPTGRDVIINSLAVIQGNNNRWFGFPLRCLSTALEG